MGTASSLYQKTGADLPNMNCDSAAFSYFIPRSFRDMDRSFLLRKVRPDVWGLRAHVFS